MVILGIDTSCDDTGVGIVRGHEVLANVVASQDDLHAEWGGVVPENASRQHLQVIDLVLASALERAGLELSQIDAVAATHGPGLVGALLVGLTFGKTLAWSLDKPFVPIHHLEGHIASALAGEEAEPPFLCLIASGGHTSLFNVKAWGDYEELGSSRDDAAGEAFDKVARLLDLGFPGGPALSQLAQEGDTTAFAFTRPLRGQTGFDFSFSGLKTAVATLLQKQLDADRADVAASFEKTVVDSLSEVTLRAAEHTGYKTLVVAGGVAANRRLRTAFEKSGLRLHLPALELATDNGAMIALAAQHRVLAQPDWSQDATPYLPLSDKPIQDSGFKI